MKRTLIIAGILPIALMSACDGGVAVDPGDGSQTLFVEAEVDLEDDVTRLYAKVQRAGSDVADAQVIFESNRGDATLTHSGGSDYNASQAGWAGNYHLDVRAGEDWLDGGIEAPDPPSLRSPDPTNALDPQQAEGGLVLLRWAGERSLRVRVKVNDFEWEGEDAGELSVPATAFDDDTTEIEIKRVNETPLAGGAPGSRLKISIEEKVQIVVTNPL